MLGAILIFIASLAVLIKGSDWFIESAELIGLKLGIPSFIIGVTIVAFGTSLPELAAAIASMSKGESELVVSTIVGSNIANILLVIGLVAIFVKRVPLRANIMDIDIPMLLFSALIMVAVLSDGHLDLVESLFLLAALTIFLFHSFSSGREEKIERIKVGWKEIGMLVLGGVCVYFGAEYTINALIKISVLLQIESEFIALSLVALGTSLPEVVVSITAAKRGQTDIAIGNVIGSNIFNTYAVLAIPSFLGTLEIPEMINSFYLPLMFGATLLFAFTCISRQISRWEGALYVLLYLYFFYNILLQFN